MLYVINHAAGRQAIEIYDLVGIKLFHRGTLSDPLLVTPNDLVAVGRDRLLVGAVLDDGILDCRMPR